MKKLLLLLSLVMTFIFAAPATSGAAPMIFPLKQCWYSTKSSQVFRVLYDNTTHSTFGSNVYIWIKDSYGTVYGPMAPTTITFDPLSGGWYYEYDAVANGIILPTPLETCYGFTYHYDTNFVEPWPSWPQICPCDETACDASFDLFFGLGTTIGVSPLGCNLGYTYTIDFGDLTPPVSMTAPYCVGMTHTYPSAGLYTVCVTATNGVQTCRKCKQICVNETTDDGGSGGNPNGRAVNNTANMEGLRSASFQVYPIPTQDVLKVDFIANNTGSTHVTITDVKGVEVRSVDQDVTEGKNSFNIKTTDLEPGMYFIRISEGKQTLIRRFNKIK